MNRSHASSAEHLGGSGAVTLERGGKPEGVKSRDNEVACFASELISDSRAPTTGPSSSHSPDPSMDAMGSPFPKEKNSTGRSRLTSSL